MRFIKKISIILLFVITFFTLMPLQAHAAWGMNDKGWYYTENDRNVTGWKQIDYYWYHFNEDGYMTTGWIKCNDNWYYLYPQDGKAVYNKKGMMATMTVVENKYFVDINGNWIDDSTFNISAVKAESTVRNYLNNKGQYPKTVACQLFDNGKWKVHCYSSYRKEDGENGNESFITYGWYCVDIDTGSLSY